MIVVEKGFFIGKPSKEKMQAKYKELKELENKIIQHILDNGLEKNKELKNLLDKYCKPKYNCVYRSNEFINMYSSLGKNADQLAAYLQYIETKKLNDDFTNKLRNEILAAVWEKEERAKVKPLEVTQEIERFVSISDDKNLRKCLNAEKNRYPSKMMEETKEDMQLAILTDTRRVRKGPGTTIPYLKMLW